MFKVIPTGLLGYTHRLVGRPNTDDPIDGAIEKWRLIVEFLEQHPNIRLWDGGGDTCPLCYEYSACVNCPVALFTGEPLCWNTPYADYHDDPAFANALAELRFLEAL